MRRIFIFGATSAIAQATGRLFAADGDSLFLAARDPEKLRIAADDLRVRGASLVETATMEATEYHGHPALIEAASRALGGLDLVMIAHGTLPDQKACEQSWDRTLKEVEINALSAISLLSHLANHLERQGHGTLVVISSVAGDRGRRSNYVYGTAKAALTTFTQGLRSRLCRSGVHVLTIKPGFVDTPMTAHFRKGLLWSTPEAVGKGIYRAIQKKRNVVYVPWFWYFVMLFIRAIPEAVFKRMNL